MREVMLRLIIYSLFEKITGNEKSILKQLAQRVNQTIAQSSIDDMKKSADKILKEQCDMIQIIRQMK